jgi:hypothetical protein
MVLLVVTPRLLRHNWQGKQPPLKGCMWASLGRKATFAVHVVGADNVLRELSAAADGVEAAFSSDGMLTHATAFFTRAMGRKRPRASSRSARGATCLFVAFPCCVFSIA